MAVSLEQIMTALQTLITNAVSGAPGPFLSVGRRVLPWSKVGSCPALFLRNRDDNYQTREGQPPRRTLHVEVWIYSKSGQNPDLAPGAALNALVDAVEGAFQPDNVLVNRQTLGGLVQHCWLEGKVEYDPGDADSEGKARAVIDVSILIP